MRSLVAPTSTWFAILAGVFVGFILPVLVQNRLAGHTTDDRQVGRRGLGYGGITPVQ